MLNQHSLSEYMEKGLLQLANGFTNHDVAAMKAELPRVLAERSERTVLEADGKSVRSVYGVHQHNRFFSRLARHPKLIGMAQQILDDNVYVYQSKINLKLPFTGDVWDWHQDYTYWYNEDGMPAPRAVSVAIYLDDVNEFNGPLYFLPCSHHTGAQKHRPAEGRPAGYEDAPSWISNLTAKLKYSIDRDRLHELTLQHGIVAPKGQAGTVLLFDCNIIHASPPNISPFGRAALILTYNRVSNAPAESRRRRPEFLASADSRPLQALPTGRVEFFQHYL